METLDNCEYCGGPMPPTDRKKHKGSLYHARCKEWQKDRDKVEQERKEHN